MAISRRTQKDVGSFEPKFIGPFTTRQTIFVGIAAVISYIIHGVVGTIDTDLTTQIMIMIIFAGPVLALGFVNPYGMRCEDFLVMYWFYHIKAPAQRKYVTVTDVDVITQQEMEKLTSEQETGHKGKNKNAKKSKGKQVKNEPPKHKKDKQIKEYA